MAMPSPGTTDTRDNLAAQETPDAPNVHQTQSSDDTPDAPDLKDSPEATDAVETIEENARETTEVLEMTDLEGSSDAPEAPHSRETIEALHMEETLESISTLESPDAPPMKQLWGTVYRASPADAPPPVRPSLKTPLLAVVAVASLVVAGWNYSTLQETRGKLTAMSDQKASVDRAFAEAQSRLAAAEKAVADVKAALTTTSSAAAAAPKKAEAVTAPAAEKAPAQ